MAHPAATHREQRVELRRLTSDDEDEFVHLSVSSAELHGVWVYSPKSSDEFASYLARFDDKNAVCMVVWIRDTQEMAGFVNISDIIRGPYQRGTIGYGAFQSKARQGYMTEGVELMVSHAFDHLSLHRVEADIRPENSPSIRLVKRVGFLYEGRSPGYVFIDGAWRDHERWAITPDIRRLQRTESA